MPLFGTSEEKIPAVQPAPPAVQPAPPAVQPAPPAVQPTLARLLAAHSSLLQHQQPPVQAPMIDRSVHIQDHSSQTVVQVDNSCKVECNITCTIL